MCITTQQPNPSLADIIRKETNNGTHIIQFLAQTMRGEIPDATAHHRLQAAKHLINLSSEEPHTQQQHTPAAKAQARPLQDGHDTPDTPQQPPNYEWLASPEHNSHRLTPQALAKRLSQHILSETDNGYNIIRFLSNVMTGSLNKPYERFPPYDKRFEIAYNNINNPKSKNFKPSHRMAAARELLNRGFILPRADLAQESSRQSRDTGKPIEDKLAVRLAHYINDTTDNGVSITSFLLDVMDGAEEDFDPGHRVSAAQELLKHAFDDIPAESGAESAYQTIGHGADDSCETHTCLCLHCEQAHPNNSWKAVPDDCVHEQEQDITKPAHEDTAAEEAEAYPASSMAKPGPSDETAIWRKTARPSQTSSIPILDYNPKPTLTQAVGTGKHAPKIRSP